MTGKRYLPRFDQGTTLVAIDTTRPVGAWSPDAAGGYSTTRATVAETAPWSALVALREWAVDRAIDIVSSGAPDAEDYGAVLATDGDGWDVALLAEMIEAVVLDDIEAIDDAWAIGPWWSRRHAILTDVRWNTTSALFPAAPRVIEQTKRHEARRDGTYRTSRQRRSMSIGGSGKRTSDGAPLSSAMARFGALLPEQGGTADDAYHAAAAMASAGLIPTALGGEDWMPQEMTPALVGDPSAEGFTGAVRIESQRENVTTRIKPLAERSHSVRHEATCAIAVDRREARKAKRPPLKASGPTVNDPAVYCSCDPTTRITERVTGPRRVTMVKATAARGCPVLADADAPLPLYDAVWRRSHVGDAVVFLTPAFASDEHYGDVTRATGIVKAMDKGRKVTRYIGGKAKPNHADNAFVAPVRGKSQVRTNRAEARASVLDALATISTEGAETTWGAWRIACETAATSRQAARFTATDAEGRALTDTPRGLASALAAL